MENWIFSCSLNFSEVLIKSVKNNKESTLLQTLVHWPDRGKMKKINMFEIKVD